MTFVIYGFSFPPNRDAESYCTSRFASALARFGHDVYVVAPEWSSAMPNDIYSFLVDHRLHVTRVPMRNSKFSQLWSRIRYFTHEHESANIALSVKVIRGILKNNPGAVLVTRSSPFLSLIVGWMCRKEATAWIAHFSDPLSLLPRGTFWSEIRYLSMRMWINRAIRDSDAISLTCENVKDYYESYHGRFWRNAISFVTNHIGEPALPCKSHYDRPGSDIRLIAHAGYLNELRSAGLILSSIRRLKDDGVNLKFLQCGRVDDYTSRLIANSPDCAEIINEQAPDIATAVCAIADVVVIADQDTDLGYIPFLPSKFAYQIFTETPIVVLSRVNSAMANYCKKYPLAGLFFAEIGKTSDLRDAIVQALSCSRAQIDREHIRIEFSQKGVAKLFAMQARKILAAKKG